MITRVVLTLAAAALSVAGCAAATPEAETTLAAGATPAPRPIHCSQPSQQPTVSARTPSRQLLNAFSVFERPATPADEPPAAAITQGTVSAGLMVGSARAVAAGTWLLPVEDVVHFQPLPTRCVKGLPAWQRRQIRKGEREAAARGPVEGVAVVHADPPQTGPAYPLQSIEDGNAYQLDGCAGPMHDKLGLRGLVPDGVTKVTVAAKDGSITEAIVDGNRFAIELPRPDSADGLPAHLTYATATGPKDVVLPPNPGLTQPCEPPSKSANGQRLEQPIPLDEPEGAQIEFGSTRWEAEDTGPVLAGATYTREGTRCLLIDTTKRLEQGKGRHRFCVDDATLKAERYVARATRLPNGDVVLEGFVDPDKIGWVTMERSDVVSGARRLVVSRRTGAFFVAHKGPRARDGFFNVRVALRGTPVRYTGSRTILLPARG